MTKPKLYWFIALVGWLCGANLVAQNKPGPDAWTPQQEQAERAPEPSSGRRLIPRSTQLETPSTPPPSSTSSTTLSTRTELEIRSGSRPKQTYSSEASDLNLLAKKSSTKTNWLPPYSNLSSSTPTINPSLPRYDNRVASNQHRKPAATQPATDVVHSAYFAPQPPAMPTFPGGSTFPPAGTGAPPSSSFPPAGTLPPRGFGGSGGTLSDSPANPSGGLPTMPQPLSPGVTGGSTLPGSTPPTSGIRPASPPAAAYPMPGIAGQGSGTGSFNNSTYPQPLGTTPVAGGTMPGATPLTNMANPNYGSTTGGGLAPTTKPRFVTGAPFVTDPPPQYEMPYVHAASEQNSCLPGLFGQTTSLPTTPTAMANNNTSGVYPANTNPTNTYPGVPGYIVPPTVTPNMAPQLFTPNNSGYTSLVNWGTESSNVAIGRGLFGGPTVYVTNEPVRNFFRYMFH